MNFNLQKFSTDVKASRMSMNLTQKDFAEKLKLENHTLVSLFEQGKRAPSKEVFAVYCDITGLKPEEYWVATKDKPSASFMEKIAPTDKESLSKVLEKIGMQEYLFALFDRVTK